MEVSGLTKLSVRPVAGPTEFMRSLTERSCLAGESTSSAAMDNPSSGSWRDALRHILDNRINDLHLTLKSVLPTNPIERLAHGLLDICREDTRCLGGIDVPLEDTSCEEMPR